uniref:Uncharacterized protein n=1 Tax=Magallana gigas TaxID=29159 RepID=K1QAF9_MAGGI
MDHALALLMDLKDLLNPGHEIQMLEGFLEQVVVFVLSVKILRRFNRTRVGIDEENKSISKEKNPQPSFEVKHSHSRFLIVVKNSAISASPIPAPYSIEQLTTAEEAVICERNEIQNQFKNIEKSLGEKSTELRKLQKQLEQKNREAAIEREKNATLEIETRKQQEKEASSQERFKALEQKLKEKNLDFENITAQVKDLEIQILSEKRHSTEVKERMADLEQEKNSKYEEAILVKERNHALEKAIEEQREKGTMMTQHIELLEHQLKQKMLLDTPICRRLDEKNVPLIQAFPGCDG